MREKSFHHITFSVLISTNQSNDQSIHATSFLNYKQGTRSIEDLYIDDDFLHGFHGLGANMELQSDYSDSLDFDMTSSGLF